MSNDLQPCPFCGGTARFNETEDGGHFIECTNCRSSTCLRYSLMDDAKPILAESWNRRAQLAAAAPTAKGSDLVFASKLASAAETILNDYPEAAALLRMASREYKEGAAPVAAAAPGAVPQTDLQREIARDAEAFEATLTERPARESSLAYPWGWRYVSNEVQGQFRDWCCRHPK